MSNCVLLVVLDERYFNFIVWAPFLYQISIVEIFSLDQSGGPNKPTLLQSWIKTYLSYCTLFLVFWEYSYMKLEQFFS